MTSTHMTSPTMTTSAILGEQLSGEMPIARSNSTRPTSSQPNLAQRGDDQRWNAVVARDSGRDGEFVFAVSSTGVYCRPSCPARRPRRENVPFFSHADHAEKAG